MVDKGFGVSYLAPADADTPIRWRAAKVVDVVSGAGAVIPFTIPQSLGDGEDGLILAYKDYGSESDLFIPINNGQPVPRRTAPTQSNVWRYY